MLERDPKRRRLTPLNAPFRSPLRRPPSTDSLSTGEPGTPLSATAPRPSDVSLSQDTTPKRKLPSRTFKSPVLGRNRDEDLSLEIIALIDRKRELERIILEEKKAIETAEMALKYEKQDQDDQMDKLISRWRTCAQKTCERVFVSVRNRIDRMGGYREFLAQTKPRSWDNDDLPERRGNSEEDYDLPEEDGAIAPEENIHEEFTMEIMLKMAGVEEKLIGWDRGLCNFIKERM